MGGGVTVGIDIGTTSVKAVAADAAGRVLARAQVPHPLVVDAPDRLAHDAARAWRRGPRRALRALGDAGAGAAAVAVSSMVPSLAAVDGRGVPVTEGLLYGDRRGRAGADGGAGRPGELLHFLRWCAAAAPGVAGYWPASAAAAHALAGRAVLDAVVPAVTGGPLWAAGAWDPAVARDAGASVDQLPAVAPVGTPIGRAAGGGPLVVTGCPDAMAEALVAGADRPGDVHVLLGTTLVVRATAPAGTDPRGWDVTSGPVPGQVRIGGASTAGGLFVSWALRNLRAAGAPPAAPDRVPVWAPYPRGERSPLHDPDRRAVLADLDLTHGVAAVRRAVFEASGFVVRRAVEAAGGPVGPDGAGRRIVATGGGTRSGEWVQAVADCTGLPVELGLPDAAALGTAFVARVGAGLEPDLGGARRWATTTGCVEPDPRWVDACAARYERFVALAAAG